MVQSPFGRFQYLHHFHCANIHERRLAAYVARCVPLGSILAVVALSVYGAFRHFSVLLWLSALFNVAMWLVVVVSGIDGLLGANRVDAEIDRECEAYAKIAKAVVRDEQQQGSDPAVPRLYSAEDTTGIVHVIIVPNYKEDEAILGDTLLALREAHRSEEFRVCLAMEMREGDAAAAKARRLEERFAGAFREVFSVHHPVGELETHIDGSVEAEVAGKGSNLKWAVDKVFQRCCEDPSVDVDKVVLTVADADCLFHPGYFTRVAGEYVHFQRTGKHKTVMWQAPQLPYRNYFTSPAPSRIWGYVSSVFEFGGVSGLARGRHHMVFSTFSVSLAMAATAKLWDGDVIAEDHHAYLKGFYHTVYQAALVAATTPAKPALLLSAPPSSRIHQSALLDVRPVMLPVKSTSVESSEGVWRGYVERWHQAKRHCQGVAELSYCVLACWDMLTTLPPRLYTWSFVVKLAKVVACPFTMHILPTCQSIALGVFSVYWFLHQQRVPACPENLWGLDGYHTPLCGFAGAFALGWPIIIPFSLVAISNYRFLCSCFLRPAELLPGTTRWHSTDGEVAPLFGSKRLAAAVLITFDCTVLLSLMMIPYGLFANLYGCWSVLLKGNRVEFITSAKAAQTGSPGYGTMQSGGNV